MTASTLGKKPVRTREKEITVYGFGRRLAASMIDALLVIFLAWVFAILASLVGWFFAMFNSSNPPPIDTLIMLSALVVSVIYFIAAWGKDGSTIGHWILGMRVIRADGSKLGYSKAILRYIGFLVSGFALSLGFLWINLDNRRQGWHDKIAGTLVISVDDEYKPGDQAKMTVNDANRPRWLWFVLWFVLLVVAPSLLFGSLLILGPVVSRWARDVLQSIMAR